MLRGKSFAIKASVLASMPLALAMGSVHAQSAPSNANVTLYGIVDVGVQYTTGLTGGKRTTLASGIMEGSRIGIRGSEDLGNGFRAIFALESRLEADTGTVGTTAMSGSQLPDRFLAGLPPAVQAALTSAVGSQLGVNLRNGLFDRQTYVGLVTPVGAILAGRQYTPAFEISNRYDVWGNASAASPGQLISIPAAIDIRESNSLMYRIEKSGFYGSAYYSFGEREGFKPGRVVGLNAGYQADRFGAGIGYNERTNSAGKKSLNVLIAGANYDFGLANVYAMYAIIKEPNSVIGPELRAGLIAGGVPVPLVDTGILPRFEQNKRLYHLGAKLPLGPGHVIVSYSRSDDKRASNADTDSYGIGYIYPFSKRTDLNFVLTQVDNNENAQVAVGGNGYLGGVTAHAGKDSTIAQISLRHRF